jgi:hypothetical protein
VLDDANPFISPGKKIANARRLNRCHALALQGNPNEGKWDPLSAGVS